MLAGGKSSIHLNSHVVHTYPSQNLLHVTRNLYALYPRRWEGETGTSTGGGNNMCLAALSFPFSKAFAVRLDVPLHGRCACCTGPRTCWRWCRASTATRPTWGWTEGRASPGVARPAWAWPPCTATGTPAHTLKSAVNRSYSWKGGGPGRNAGRSYQSSGQAPSSIVPDHMKTHILHIALPLAWSMQMSVNVQLSPTCEVPPTWFVFVCSPSSHLFAPATRISEYLLSDWHTRRWQTIHRKNALF